MFTCVKVKFIEILTNNYVYGPLIAISIFSEVYASLYYVPEDEKNLSRTEFLELLNDIFRAHQAPLGQIDFLAFIQEVYQDREGKINMMEGLLTFI